MKAAVVQLNSTADRDGNLETAERLVRAAGAAGAELVVMPEKWNLLGPDEVLIEGAEPLGGPSIEAARSWARELGIHLLAGSIAERVEGRDLPANTSSLIGPDGGILATYRKIHMFDVEVEGVSYRESDHSLAGDRTALAEGPAGTKIGMAVCYDLRFPEMFALMAARGAEIFTLPAAFTTATGRDHWQVLLRARAIENQAFVVAAGQIGPAPPHYESYGRSCLVDPWGVVLATVPDHEGYALAELDLDAQKRVRAGFPSLANRRPEAYR